MGRFIHDAAGIYINNVLIPVEFFKGQEPSYYLPENATGRIYVQAGKHQLLNSDIVWDAELPWAEGDNYISKLAQIETEWQKSQIKPNWKAFRKALIKNGAYATAIAALNNHNLRRLEEELNVFNPDVEQIKEYWDAVVGAIARPAAVVANLNALCVANNLPVRVGADSKLIII